MVGFWLRCLIICCCLVAASASHAGGDAQKGKDLTTLEVFTEGFPRTLLFRPNSLERWEREGKLDAFLLPFNGMTTKYVGEEGPFSPQLPTIMAAYKRRHPRELCLLHMNGEARTITHRVFHERYFPGHWVYRPGEVLKFDVSETAAEIRVDNPKRFAIKVPMRKGNEVVGEMLPSIILVPLDRKGDRLWYESEYAQITGIDGERGILTVQRGQYFSRARAFRAGRTYAAPMHCEHWNGLEWTLNMSAACPKDRNGETAADVCLRELKEWCSAGGPAAHVDGIGFDVIYYLAKFSGWDLNNDGRPDDGIAADGSRFQMAGVAAFLKRLRDAVGEDFLLVSDGWDPKNQRAVGIFNGIESEGLCAPNDAWRMYARMFNVHTYWNEWNNAKYRYSYITAKMLHPADQQMKAPLFRLGLASACVLGVSYGNVGDAGRKDGLPMIPEMHRGAANQTNWLGRAQGPMVVVPKSSPDLLEGRGATMAGDFVRRLEAKRCRVSKGPDGTLLIQGTSKNPYDTMEVTLRGLSIAKGDLCLFFEALAVDPLQGFGQQDRIPRLITLHAEGLPKYTDQRGARSQYNDITAYMGTGGFTPQCGYFRRAGEGGGVIDLTFVFEDQGACKLRNLTMHNAPMVVIRDFENGVVLANASEESVAIDLRRLLPDVKAKRLRRIKADPSAYRKGPETDNSLAHNDGREERPDRIVVPPRDGLFLEK